MHTPGPWRVVEDGSRSDGLWVSPPNGSESVICDLVGRVFDVLAGCTQITKEDEANARLIAAAPDLLTSLREFVALYDGTRDMLGESIKAKLERAEAAITKAEGASK